jgi:cell division septum initiation protein DivIVA
VGGKVTDYSSNLPPDEDEGVPTDLDADTLLRRSLEIVSTAKTMPLSASVLVSRDELSELLTAALERLPEEIRQARWLLKERDEFIAERRREADALMEEVKVQAERMVSRAEIVRQANQVAQRILDDANEDARRMRHEVEDYCDQRLAGMEIVLDRLMRTVKSGRERLQATSFTAAESAGTAGSGGAATGEESSEDGFFDQDRA